MTPDRPIARLKPGGRDHRVPARTHMVGTGQPTGSVDAGRGGDTGAVALREWHTLTSVERDAAWADLVEWVVWLHDRYELATEYRLPHCWPQHPGLIEELHALRVWREQIYTAEQPSGQAARYWHAELRQVVQAATTIYAKGCRSGHRAPAPLAATDEALRARWLEGDPLTGVSPQRLTVPAPPAGSPTVLTPPQMRAAIDAGHTRPVGRLIPDYQHYQGHWWTLTADATGWQQITDPAFSAELDAAAERMHIADALAETHQRPDDPR